MLLPGAGRAAAWTLLASQQSSGSCPLGPATLDTATSLPSAHRNLPLPPPATLPLGGGPLGRPRFRGKWALRKWLRGTVCRPFRLPASCRIRSAGVCMEGALQPWCTDPIRVGTGTPVASVGCAAC